MGSAAEDTMPALSHEAAFYDVCLAFTLTIVQRCSQMRAIEGGCERRPIMVPAGANWIVPPATPASSSVVSTTSSVGSCAVRGSKRMDGGTSSMYTPSEPAPVL